MAAFGKEAFQPLLRLRNGIRRCDADTIEAVRTRSFNEGVLDRCRIGQKSRSA
jgi:hypothetical protein